MTVINAFADKTECPHPQCAYADAPDEKGMCCDPHCPFDLETRGRWLSTYLAESGEDQP